MSIQAINWVLWKSKSKGGARNVAIAIADDHNVQQGCAAWPSIRRIAIKANLSRRQVQYHIIHLVQLGELKRQYRYWPGGKDNQTSLFTFVKMTAADFELPGQKAPGDTPANEVKELPIPLPKEARAWDKKKVARWQLQKEIEQVKARLNEHQDTLSKSKRYVGPNNDKVVVETQAAILALRSDLKELQQRFDQKLY
jgi:hypothetical protein